MGRKTRVQKRVDYASVNRKYDAYSFKPTAPVAKAVRIKAVFAGRAIAAPARTVWTGGVLHPDVEYFDHINANPLWNAANLVDDVKLPFASLDLTQASKWQGLVQTVPMNGDAVARSHFDAVSARLRTGASNPTITEAVGEAAAAMAMLAAGGYEMIWGFHIHAGTGIDQIWRRPLGHNTFAYHIVEAKGPNAGLGGGPFVPPDYSQMERGWVINHLRSMSSNGHVAGTDIVAQLGLVFNIAHLNFGGATKSYYGLASSAPHAVGRLTGQVITARWQAGGRLGWVASASIIYL